MRYWTRKHGSQRTSKVQQITFEQNFAGQGGFSFMSFQDEKKVWHIIQPENIKEVRELQSQAGILSLNVKETRS